MNDTNVADEYVPIYKASTFGKVLFSFSNRVKNYPYLVLSLRWVGKN